ncbi:MAG: TonB-dependent receptor [Deltaproteobacteria bacterium]|jgi:iron complex outermembrane receptor protein
MCPRWTLIASAAVVFAAPAYAQTGTSTAAPEVVPPSLLHQPSIPYPPDAKARGVEGVVALDLVIDEIGEVRTATVVRGVDPVLDAAALEAVKEFRFSPAMEDGVPFEVTVGFAYRFVLPTEDEDAEVVATSSVAPPADVGTGHSNVPIDGIDSAFSIVVLAKRPPRSASDWTFTFGVTHAAPAAGGSGAELLREAPGVYISQHSGQGKGHQIFLRGFDAVHGQDVAISAGGIAVNEVSNVHGQGYADLHFLIPEAVAKMRVVEGAYDPRQGDFAVAGSIDFDLGLTRRGMLGRVSAGQFGLVRGLAAWGPEGEPDETFVAAEYARSDGFGPSRAWNRSSAIAQSLVDINANVKLRLLGSSYAGRFDSPGVVRLDAFEAGTIGFYDVQSTAQRGSSTRHQALAEVRYDDGSTQSRMSTYVVLRGFRLRQNFTGYLLDPRGDLNEQLHDATTFGGSGYYSKTLFDERLRVEIGASWRHDAIEQTQDRLREVDGVSYAQEIDNELEITDVGFYADFNLRLMDGLFVRGGARVEGLSYVIEERLANEPRREAFGLHVAPKATVDYQPVDALRLFLSYGNGFRSPQAVSLGQGERSPLTLVHSGELGARYRYGRALRATLTSFVTYVEDELVFDHATGTNVFGGSTLRGGVQALVQSAPFDFLNATLAATFARGIKPATGDVLPFVPPLVLRFDVEAHEHVRGLLEEPIGVFAVLAGTYLAPRPLPFSETAEGFFVAEAAIGAEYDRFALSVEAQNLFDARYRDAEFVYASDFNPGGGTSMVPARHFTAGPPLTLQATLTVNY